MARAARARRGLLASAGGSPRWHVMVGEQGGQAVEQHGGSTGRGRDRAVPGPARPWGTARAACGSRARARPVGGARPRPDRCRSRRRRTTSWRSATSSQDGLYALGSMAVPKASTAAAAVAMPGEGEGELPAGALGRVGTVAQRPIGEPGDDTGLVGRQPCAAADLVAPTEDRQFVAGAVEAGHRDRRAGTAFVAVGRHDQRHPRDDPADHDQQAHRSQRTSLSSTGEGVA